MTIKLSNKHHPAMIPNADCGRARRESESDGSRIVSSHFDAKLKTLVEKKNQTSTIKERRKRRRLKKGERGRDAIHANTLCKCALVFVSLVVQLITFIRPDLKLNL